LIAGLFVGEEVRRGPHVQADEMKRLELCWRYFDPVRKT
jgi:hypothetical protein